MKTDLEPVKTILLKFREQLLSRGLNRNFFKVEPKLSSTSIRGEISTFDANEILLNETRRQSEEEAYIWLYAEPISPHSLMHRPKTNPLPVYYQQHAINLYEEWINTSKNIIDRGVIIPTPSGDISLIDYLLQLESQMALLH